MHNHSTTTVTEPESRPGRVEIKARYMLALAAGLFISARLWRLTSYGIYGDETFSLWVARQSWWGAIVGASEDVVHPPLFYLLLKAWVAAGGESIVWLKLFPVLTSFLSIAPFAMLCRELRLDRATTSLALGLMAVNCYSVIYAQDLRMYSLVSLFAICSMWVFARAINSGGARALTHVALFAINLLLVYTHYYGWLLVGVELLCFLIWSRRDLIAFSVSTAALIAAFIPWCYMVIQAAAAKGGLGSNIGWNLRPGISDVVWFFMNLVGPISYRWEIYGWLYPLLLALYPVLFIMLLMPAARWLGESVKEIRAGRRRQADSFWPLFLFSSLPVLVSVVASHVLSHSVWGIRYLIISAPGFFILIAASVMRLPSSRLKRGALIALIAWSPLAGFTEMYRRDRLIIEPLVRQLLEKEDSQLREALIYCDDGNVRNTVQYYMEAASRTRFQTVYVRDISEMKGESFWVVSLKYRFDHTRTLQTAFAEMGYEVSDLCETRSSGHTVYLFSIRSQKPEARSCRGLFWFPIVVPAK